MIDESQTYSDGTLRPVSDAGLTDQYREVGMDQPALREPDTQPVKRKRGGRVKGSKNKPKNAPEQPVTEAEVKSLREFIREITTGEEFRDALKTRIKTGKLSPGESRMVEKILDAPVEKKKEGWQRMLAVATEQERVLLADLFRRAIAQGDAARKRSKRVLSTPEPVTVGKLLPNGDSPNQVLSGSGVEQGLNDLPGRSNG
jgi:hypothetical protein